MSGLRVPNQMEPFMSQYHLPLHLQDYPLPVINQDYGYIYFLFDSNDTLLYIGQTISLEYRIFTHLKNNEIPFTKCKYITCDKWEMNEIEFKFIVINSPPYNGPPPTSKIWISIERIKLKFPNFKGKTIFLKNQLKKSKYECFHGYYRIEDIISLHTLLFGGAQ